MSIDDFYTHIVQDLKAQGIPCAITGGLACVEFGIVQHTEDCDLICAPEFAPQLLEVLGRKQWGATPCQYRGNLSPPLDTRWLSGGYTCHFHWPSAAEEQPFLDVFGAPPRVSTPWAADIQGLLAGRHTVAEMKRTNRRKDWDQATALGLQLLERGDKRGWLHIFDADALRDLLSSITPGADEISQRPVLQLATENSPLLDRAVQTEIDFWTQLNRARLAIYVESLRRYAIALRQDKRMVETDLRTQHAIRLEYAGELLPDNPIRDFGVDRLIDQAKTAVAVGIDPALLLFLPNAKVNFSPETYSSETGESI